MNLYSEFPAPAAMQSHILCLWASVSSGPSRSEIVPDGCVDIVVSGDGEPMVVGPDTGPWTYDSVGPVCTIGLRFVPGTARCALRLSVSEMLDTQFPLADLWGASAHRVRDRLARTPVISEKLSELAEAVFARCAAVDRRVADAIVRIARNPRTSVAELGEQYEITPRHVSRLFDSDVGYGPRTLARVLRLQRALDLLRGESSQLAEVALVAGYADQSHMTRDFRELLSQSPVHAVGRGSTVTVSDLFKTAFAVPADNSEYEEPYD